LTTTTTTEINGSQIDRLQRDHDIVFEVMSAVLFIRRRVLVHFLHRRIQAGEEISISLEVTLSHLVLAGVNLQLRAL